MEKSRPRSISISGNQIREIVVSCPCETEPYNKSPITVNFGFPWFIFLFLKTTCKVVTPTSFSRHAQNSFCLVLFWHLSVAASATMITDRVGQKIVLPINHKITISEKRRIAKGKIYINKRDVNFIRPPHLLLAIRLQKHKNKRMCTHRT